MEAPIVFNARATFAWKRDRLYRVYILEEALYFIRIGGQGGVGEAAAGSLGLLGAGALHVFRQRGKKKQAERLAVQDQRHPEQYLSAHKHNFRLRSTEVTGSSIEPPALFGSHGTQFGRWLIAWAGGKMSLQFEQLEDMRTAVAHLPALLGPRLTVNV
jgi:hypothetical protein